MPLIHVVVVLVVVGLFSGSSTITFRWRGPLSQSSMLW